METSKHSPVSGRVRSILSRKWVARSLFVAASLATLIALFYVVENWRGHRAWNQFARTWEAKGEHFEVAAFIPPEVPAGENFAATPFFAPLFNFRPGTQQWRDTNAVERIKAFPQRYEAASGRLPRENRPATNTWVRPWPDLRSWYAAFHATNGQGAGSAVVSEMGMPSGAAPEEAVPENTFTNVSLDEAASGVLAGLAETEPVLAELREAAQRPFSRFDLRYEEENLMTLLLPHLSPLRRMSGVLQLRATAHLALGREPEAFEDTILMFRLAQAVQSEPLLISYLVRVAQLQLTIRVIAEGLEQHQWTDAQLRVFQEELGKVDLLAEGKRALRAERAFSGSFIQAMAQDPESFASVGSYDAYPEPLSGSQRLLIGAIPDGWFYLERLNFSRLFQHYALPAIDVKARRVNPSVTHSFNEEVQELSKRSAVASFLRHETMARVLLPALDKAIQRMALAQAGVDAARVACALERYRLARGNYPESLAALEPEFMSGLPHDVISGEPLKYRVSRDGEFILYSVGWNRVNDGGNIVYQKNGRTMELTEGDWVWR